MKHQLKTIDYEWLTKPTGDPFANIWNVNIKILTKYFVNFKEVSKKRRDNKAYAER
jgi:hypothetical protein